VFPVCCSTSGTDQWRQLNPRNAASFPPFGTGVAYGNLPGTCLGSSFVVKGLAPLQIGKVPEYSTDGYRLCVYVPLFPPFIIQDRVALASAR
jgi:hypothetical protein